MLHRNLSRLCTGFYFSRNYTDHDKEDHCNLMVLDDFGYLRSMSPELIMHAAGFAPFGFYGDDWRSEDIKLTLRRRDAGLEHTYFDHME